MTVVEIAAIVIAIAFAVLVGYLVPAPTRPRAIGSMPMS